MSDRNPDQAERDQFDQLAPDEVSAFVPETAEHEEALLGAVGYGDHSSAYSRMIDIGDRYLGMTSDGVGTKLSVAHEMEAYATIGLDAVTVPVNDLLAEGLTPVAYTNYLAVEEANEAIAQAIGTGLVEGAEKAGILLLGGEMNVKPETISGFDLVGTAGGIGEKDVVFPGDAAVGDRLVGFPSSGIHASGIGRALSAFEDTYELDDPFPEDESQTIGDRILQPTRIYTYLLDSVQDSIVHAAVHLTDMGWTTLMQMGEYQYTITDPIQPQALFDLIQDAGEISLEEMYRTFNMGTGFVVAAPESAATEIVSETDGEIIGAVERGSGVHIRGMEIER